MTPFFLGGRENVFGENYDDDDDADDDDADDDGHGG